MSLAAADASRCHTRQRLPPPRCLPPSDMLRRHGLYRRRHDHAPTPTYQKVPHRFQHPPTPSPGNSLVTSHLPTPSQSPHAIPSRSTTLPSHVCYEATVIGTTTPPPIINTLLFICLVTTLPPPINTAANMPMPPRRHTHSWSPCRWLLRYQRVTTGHYASRMMPRHIGLLTLATMNISAELHFSYVIRHVA